MFLHVSGLKGVGRCCAALAAVFLILLTSCANLHAQEPDSGGGQEQQSHGDRGYPPIQVEIVKTRRQAEIEQNRAEIRQQYDKSYLDAQQGMLQAAQRASDYALWQMRGSWLAAFLLLITVGLMIQANHFALTAVKSQRQIGQAQVRAYLAADHVKLTADIDNTTRVPTALQFAVSFKNVGQSPARDLLCKGTAFIHNPRKGPVAFEDSVDLSDAQIGSLGAGVSGMCGSNTISVADLLDAARAGNKIVVAVYYEFKDVFDNKHADVMAMQADPVTDFASLICAPIEALNTNSLFQITFVR